MDVKLRDCLGHVLVIACGLIQSREDAMRNGGRSCATAQHFLEQPNASSGVVGLHTTIHKSIVDQLVTTQSSMLNSLRNL